jgi:glucan-binding YG repeat protein
MKMREIIFNAKRIDSGEWVYFNQHGAYVDEKGNEIYPKRFIRDCGFKVDPETVVKMS